jgi:hypothetical protein
LEQARRKLGTILWCDSVIFGKNFSDGRILSAILFESRLKSSHLGCRVANGDKDGNGQRRGNWQRQLLTAMQQKQWRQQWSTATATAMADSNGNGRQRLQWQRRQQRQ